MRRCWILALCAWPGVLGAAGPTSLDEVMCALCHLDQGEEFALSLHYRQGLLLCNDCHGGDPFEPDPELAKAPRTGFIGKPRREDIARICGKCHAGPAEFFARGPHRQWRNKDNPTCITCHHNHRVLKATLALMDTACTRCHAPGTPALEAGLNIRHRLEAGREELRALQAEVDSLRTLDRTLERAAPHLELARAALRESDPRTHALEMGLIEEKMKEFRRERAAIAALAADYAATRTRRRWIVAGVWGFVAFNLVLLWRRRQLD